MRRALENPPRLFNPPAAIPCQSARSPLAAWLYRDFRKLAHEFVTKNLPVKLEPNRRWLRLIGLGYASNL